MNSIEMKMPRLGTNDNYATIGQWNVKNGSYVKKGTLIAVVETTKETQEIEAEADGYIQLLYQEGEDVLAGSVLARICDTQIESVQEKSLKKDTEFQNLQVTKKAEELIKKYSVDISALDTKKVIRERDILQLISEQTVEKTQRADGIVIVSGGGLAKMCIDTLMAAHQFPICGITEKNMEKGQSVMGIPVIGDDTALDEFREKGCRLAVNAVGGISNRNTDEKFFLRKQIYEMIKKKGFYLPNLVHPKAAVENSVEMGEGNLVFAGAVIGSCAKIGNNCIINTGSIVSHDCTIGNHVKISPAAVLGGNVSVGDNSLIGMGVTVYFGVRIGKNVIIANGRHIFSDVPDYAVIK